MFGIQVKDSCPVGRRYYYTPPHGGATLAFWAEGGLVCVEDQTTGEYITWTQAEAKDSFRAIGQQLYKIDIFAIADTYFKDLGRGYNRLVDDIRAVLQDARDQGDPMQDVVIQRKERAEIGSQLAGYGRSLSLVHQDGEKVRDVPLDPRARRLPSGMIWLPHGQGQKFERKSFSG